MVNIKLDLHIHSIYSGDSIIKPKEIIKYIQYIGLDGFAICDHNNLKAFKKLENEGKKNDLVVIPGMEIETDIGEVIGLFLENEISTKNQDFISIVENIKENNGLIIIPHPFDFLRRNHLKIKLLNENIIKKYIDGVEIINSRIIFKTCIKNAKKFKDKYPLFETGGSDAHTPKEIGNAYTLINNTEKSLESIKRSLISKNSKSMGIRSNPLVHVKTMINKLKKGSYFL
ncbi:MAG: PHP domain-containing protein [Candidatus Lokiarchaeota archaeon]|nr:PHP domain-containing protein [Candidatus Lokiarchaeota archaeon]